MTETQHAVVTIKVALEIEKEASLKERESAICRALRFDIGDEISLEPGLLRDDVQLTEVE